MISPKYITQQSGKSLDIPGEKNFPEVRQFLQKGKVTTHFTYHGEKTKYTPQYI